MADDQTARLDEEEEREYLIFESRLEELYSLRQREARDYLILESRMEQLESPRRRTVARWFWGSAAIGAVSGIVFGFERSVNEPDIFQPVWASSITFCLVFAIFAGLLGYLLGQAVGMIRFRRDRQLAISPEELQRYRDYLYRGFWPDKMDEMISVVREQTYVGPHAATELELGRSEGESQSESTRTRMREERD